MSLHKIIMIKNSIISIAKNLIRNNNKNELYSLLKLCKDQGIDISKDIDYEYKERYEGEKILLVSMKIKEYNTEDKYVDNYIRCYIEIDNMVSEGIETMLTIQAREEEYDSFPQKIIDSIVELKTELLREIIEDCLEEDIDPKKMLADFKLMYHYVDSKSKEFLSGAKASIEENLSKDQFIKLQDEIIKEYEELNNMEDIELPED